MRVREVGAWVIAAPPTPAAPRRDLGRSPVGPVAGALLLIGVGALATTGTIVGLLLYEGHPSAWLAALLPIVGLVYVAAGLVAWRRRPSSRLGLLLVLAGGSWLFAALYNLDAPFAETVGAVTQTLFMALILHLLLAFPSGRLRGTAERTVVAMGYVVSVVLQAPSYLFAPSGPLAVADRPDLVAAGTYVQRGVGLVVVIAGASLLLQRMRRATPEQRRVLVPLAVYGIFALIFVPVSSLLADSLFAGHGTLRLVAALAVLALLPVVFVVAASRGGFARTGDIAELGAWLGADELGRRGLRDALATTLGDPSVQLLFRLSDDHTLVDERGIAVPRPVPPSARGAVDVELGGRVVGAITYDAVLLDREDEIREASRVVAIALDRQRLTVELRASRTRIAVAASQERRRIARDLHDGLQARLVFLAIQAGAGADPIQLRDGIRSAVDELRELVDGVMPAILTERGLGPAVEDLRDRMRAPIEIVARGLPDRPAPDVETAAYFVATEAVVNAVKHARCTAMTVTIERTADRLVLVVTDDGVGGVRPGHGVRGMADRVAALGGELTVVSPSGGGTDVRAVIPCGS